jgi:RNA polymerase sigma-70 factor (ECF subfamily)
MAVLLRAIAATAELSRSVRSLSDVELVRAAKAGSGSGSESGAGPAMSATQELLRRHGDRLFRIVSLRFPSRSIAEDIVQETFLRAMAEVSGLREEQSFFAWLVRISIRIGLDEQKKHWRELYPGEVPEEQAEQPIDLQDQEAVHRALTALDEDTRELIVLRYWAGLSVAELAEILDAEEPAVRKRLERARAKLERRLRGWFWSR